MTQNLKSLLKLAFKPKSTQNASKKKKKIKSFLKFTTKSKHDSSAYLTRYNCKNKKIDKNNLTNNLSTADDTISNLLPFKPLPTQILIAPPLPLQDINDTIVNINNNELCMKNCKNQIEIKLSTATKDKPANIPMLIIKSYKADSKIALKQANIRKGSAVNALYMLCNNWIYVKTFDDNEGFIPKYCFEPFASTTISTSKSKMNNNNNQNIIIPENTNHTYISIIDTNNDTKLKINDHDEYMIDDEHDDITNLSLFSVSRCFNIDSTILTTTTTTTSTCTSLRKISTTTSMKSYSKKYYIKSTLNNNRQTKRTNYIKKHDRSIIMIEKKNKDLKKVKKSTRKQIPKQQQQQPQEKKRHSISSESESIDTYDLLVKCSSSNKNSKLTLYQVMFDYIADFKDDISVKKGDMVYSVNENDFENKDWIFVKPYKTYKNQHEDSDGGFIPRNYLIQL